MVLNPPGSSQTDTAKQTLVETVGIQACVRISVSGVFSRLWLSAENLLK